MQSPCRYSIKVVIFLARDDILQCVTRKPDWRRAPFGLSYDCLLAVKRNYNPDDVLGVGIALGEIVG